MTLEEILQSTETFRYQLLSRMQQDCEYYLGYGGRDTKYLWAIDEREHIMIMREIYASFPFDQRPEWLTLEEIDSYEQRMLCKVEIMPAIFIFYDEEGHMKTIEVDDVEKATVQYPFLIMKNERYNNPYARLELQGKPCFENFCGPMWNGDQLRYESIMVYNHISID